jgi:hypothetical protein
VLFALHVVSNELMMRFVQQPRKVFAKATANCERPC